MARNKDLDITALQIPQSAMVALRMADEAARPAAWARQIARHSQPLVAVDFGARLLRRFDAASAPGVLASTLSERFTASASQPSSADLPLARQPDLAPRLGQARWSGPSWPAATRATVVPPASPAEPPSSAPSPLLGDLDALGWGQPVARSAAPAAPPTQLPAQPASAPLAQPPAEPAALPLRRNAEPPSTASGPAQAPVAPIVARQADPGEPPAPAAAPEAPAAPAPVAAPAEAASPAPTAPAPAIEPIAPAAEAPAAAPAPAEPARFAPRVERMPDVAMPAAPRQERARPALDLPVLRTAALRPTALISRMPAHPLERMGLALPESLGARPPAASSPALPPLDQPVARMAATPAGAAPAGAADAPASQQRGPIARAAAPPSAPTAPAVSRAPSTPSAQSAPAAPSASSPDLPLAGAPLLPPHSSAAALGGVSGELPLVRRHSTGDEGEDTPPMQAMRTPAPEAQEPSPEAPARTAAREEIEPASVASPAPLAPGLAEPGAAEPLARSADLAPAAAAPRTSPWLLTTLLLQRHSGGAPGLAGTSPLLLRTWSSTRSETVAGSPAAMQRTPFMPIDPARGSMPSLARAPIAAANSAPGSPSVARSAILAPLPMLAPAAAPVASLASMAAGPALARSAEPPSVAAPPAIAPETAALTPAGSASTPVPGWFMPDAASMPAAAPIERSLDWSALPLVQRAVAQQNTAPGQAGIATIRSSWQPAALGAQLISGQVARSYASSASAPAITPAAGVASFAQRPAPTQAADGWPMGEPGAGAPQSDEPDAGGPSEWGDPASGWPWQTQESGIARRADQAPELPTAHSLGRRGTAQPSSPGPLLWGPIGRSPELPARPALDLVQPRQSEVQRALPESPPAPAPAEAPAGPAAPADAAAAAAPNVEELANKVYEHLRRRLLIEQERRGRPR